MGGDLGTHHGWLTLKKPNVRSKISVGKAANQEEKQDSEKKAGDRPENKEPRGGAGVICGT